MQGSQSGEAQFLALVGGDEGRLHGTLNQLIGSRVLLESLGVETWGWMGLENEVPVFDWSPGSQLMATQNSGEAQISAGWISADWISAVCRIFWLHLGCLLRRKKLIT